MLPPGAAGDPRHAVNEKGNLGFPWGKAKTRDPVGRRQPPAAFVRRLTKPPLCKGRCHGNAVTEGLLQYQRTTPQACSTPAPLAQGSRKTQKPCRDRVCPQTEAPRPVCLFSSRSCFHPTAESKFQNRISASGAPKFKNATLYG